MKPLPCHAPIIKSSLSLELHIQTSFQMFHVANVHNEIVRVFKQEGSSARNVTRTGNLMLCVCVCACVCMCVCVCVCVCVCACACVRVDNSCSKCLIRLYEMQYLYICSYCQDTYMINNPTLTLGPIFDLKFRYFCL